MFLGLTVYHVQIDTVGGGSVPQIMLLLGEGQDQLSTEAQRKQFKQFNTFLFHFISVSFILTVSDPLVQK